MYQRDDAAACAEECEPDHIVKVSLYSLRYVLWYVMNTHYLIILHNYDAKRAEITKIIVIFFRAVILWINLLYHIALIAAADFCIGTNHISK